MLDVLRSLLDIVKNLIDFVVHSIQSFLNLLAAIPRFTAYIFNLVNNLIPAVLKPFIIISIIAGVVMLILGRNK